MTGYERVKRAIHFESPDRIPYNFDSNRSPVPLKHEYGEDFVWCFLDKHPDFIPKNENGDRVDEWGCIWQTKGETFGEPKFFPLEGLEEYAMDTKLPDYLLDCRYESIRRTVRENTERKYVLGMLPTAIFQIMLHLFGFEDFMCQIAGNTEEFQAFASRLNDYVIQIIDKFADAGVDGIILIEDMGLQDRMMISPTMWKEIYYPLYKKMFTHAHERGLDTFSHTCGHIVDILDMYIDAGLDVIQQDQQDNMGLEILGERFAGKVCFFDCLDIQTSLNYTKEEMIAKAEKMVKHLGTKKGGFMAKTYPQPDALHMSDRYLKEMTDAFKLQNYQNCIRG